MNELGEVSLGRSLIVRHPGKEPALAGSRCPECGDVRIPMRTRCGNHPVDCEQFDVGGAGTIYESVHISIPPSGFENPFWAGFIDLDDGPRFFAQIACADGESAPKHGERVQMVVEAIGTADAQVLAPVFKRVSDDAAV
ncbi:putative OB-fold protein [Rhodococcus sp. 27YEA15]|uniref:Zn-ribbon domain-containing OB-fold protein n=1 Tax=Rhodococcus sp. 27YEA15 TaxID=3156259 RepID=UPI003C7CFD45